MHQPTSIIEENGKFVVQIRHEFSSMEEAQAFLAHTKTDRRKNRPRIFEELCEYLPDSSITHKRAKCKICFQLYGHVNGVEESTYTLSWTVGEAAQHESKERENNAVSRHLKSKIKSNGTIVKVEDLHRLYNDEPQKYADPAPPPQHEPVMQSIEDWSDLTLALGLGEQYQVEVYRITVALCFMVIAMQQPVEHAISNIENHAKEVLKQNGCGLIDNDVYCKFNVSRMETFLCKLPRSELTTSALTVLQKCWFSGVRKAPKNRDFFQLTKLHFDKAFATYMDVIEKCIEIFPRAVNIYHAKPHSKIRHDDRLNRDHCNGRGKYRIELKPNHPDPVTLESVLQVYDPLGRTPSPTNSFWETEIPDKDMNQARVEDNA